MKKFNDTPYLRGVVGLAAYLGAAIAFGEGLVTLDAGVVLAVGIAALLLPSSLALHHSPANPWVGRALMTLKGTLTLLACANQVLGGVAPPSLGSIPWYTLAKAGILFSAAFGIEQVGAHLLPRNRLNGRRLNIQASTITELGELRVGRAFVKAQGAHTRQLEFRLLKDGDILSTASCEPGKWASFEIHSVGCKIGLFNSSVAEALRPHVWVRD